MKFLLILNLYCFYLPSLLFAIPNPNVNISNGTTHSEIDLQRKLSDYKSFNFMTAEEHLVPFGKNSELILDGSTPISKTEEKVLSCKLESQNFSNCGALFPTGTEFVASFVKKINDVTIFNLAVRPDSIKYVSPFGACQSNILPSLKLKCMVRISKRTDLKRFLPDKNKLKDKLKSIEKEKKNLDSNDQEIIVDDFHQPEKKKINTDEEITKINQEEKEINEFEGVSREFVLSDLINGVYGFTIGDIKL
ncbi:MAG: hypothetical protein QE271_10290 [Bacteriovoracaceae bacterium]|nr:hypothetical protein [Bacteriovoracaceae bacterium]